VPGNGKRLLETASFSFRRVPGRCGGGDRRYAIRQGFSRKRIDSSKIDSKGIRCLKWKIDSKF
jgi:hypothetical protein